MAKATTTEKAVKDALQERDMLTVNDTLKKLTDAMETGFKGVHERQDMTNGKVLKANNDIQDVKAKFQYNRIIWYLFTASISVIIALVSYILFKHADHTTGFILNHFFT